ITDELKATRQKLSLLKAALDKARAAEAAQRWDDALRHWNEVGTIHGDYPNLSAEIERVQRALDSARSGQIAARARSIEAKIATGEFTKAVELIRKAQAEHPQAEVFTGLAT